MTVQVLLPRLGVGMTEGTISEWVVADGTTVTQGQPIYVVETDKVESEVEATASGVLRIVAAPGTTLAVGELVAEIG